MTSAADNNDRDRIVAATELIFGTLNEEQERSGSDTAPSGEIASCMAEKTRADEVRQLHDKVSDATRDANVTRELRRFGWMRTGCPMQRCL